MGRPGRGLAYLTAGLLSVVAGTATMPAGAAAVPRPAAAVIHYSRPQVDGTGVPPGAAIPAAAPATEGPLLYGGGVVLVAPTVYLSFWGPEWNSGAVVGGYPVAQAKTYLASFFDAAGGSAWENVLTQYCQNAGLSVITCPAAAAFVGNAPGQYRGQWVDATVVPGSPSADDIRAAAIRAERHFGYHPGAVYFVMTPSGKSPARFGLDWCGYHSGFYEGATAVPFAYLPFMPDAGRACGVNSVYGPQSRFGGADSFGHGYFDGYSIVGGHEYAEAITDPFPTTGWIDAGGEENGDKCQWSGRETDFEFPNGQHYAVQPTWSNSAGGCALSSGVNPVTPPPTPTPTPTPPPSVPYTTYFSWFDNVSPGMAGDNIHLVNPGSTMVTGSVRVGERSLGFGIGAGQEGFYTFPPGTIGGPVVVAASGRVVASQRVQRGASFNEIRANTVADAAQDLWLPWYDSASPGMDADNLHLVNPGTGPAAGTITIGDPASPAATAGFSVGAGGTTVAILPPGIIGGPVHIHANAAVLATQRVTYNATFNESQAMPGSAAAGDLYFNWFDLASPGMANDNIHLVNPGSAPLTGTARLRSTGASIGFSIPAQSATYVSFGSGAIGGPVEVTADHPVLATQRVQYYGSFNESAGRAPALAAATSYLAWYDLASPGMTGDNIHIVNAGPAPVNGTVTLLGGPSATFAIAGGAEWFTNLGVTIGGPVTIQVTTPGGAVLVSQRVQYGESFNEAPAST